MRAKLFPFALLVVSAALAGCGDDFTEVARGQLTVEPTEVQFRAVAVGELPDTATVLVRNTNDEGTIRIESIELATESPYVTLSYNGDQGTLFQDIELGPNAFKQLDLQYAPQAADPGCGTPPEGEPADYCGAIIITSNSLNNPITTVKLRVPTEAGSVDVSPRTLEFESATPGDPAQSLSFVVRNTGENQLTVRSMQPSFTPEAEFELDAPTIPLFLDAGQAAEFTVTFTAQETGDVTRRGTITFETDDALSPLVSVTIQVGNPNAPTAEITTSQAGDNRTLSFVEINAGQSGTETVTITNAGGATAAALTVAVAVDPADTADYAISDGDGDARAGTVCPAQNRPMSCSQDIFIPRGGSQTLDVTYAPQVTASNATLILTTNDPANPEVRIALNGSAGIGFLAVEPSFLTYTNPVADTPITQTLTFTNAGTVPVNITGVTKANFAPAAGADLITLSQTPTAGSPIAVSPGAEVTLDVTFTRDAGDTIGQAYIGELIFSNDGSGGDVSVTIDVKYE